MDYYEKVVPKSGTIVDIGHGKGKVNISYFL